ncbi:MAG TPA: nucleotide pyrophosphatase/phosphodiesterase family protein [Jatrophihabitans sp.]|nr:nucleotide pyrophosphatase/phosphodiesterase family protein [Jatrophihabitans sp.]
MPSIRDILPGTVALLGVPVGDADRLDLGARLGQVSRVALLLVDGMGYHLLPEMAPHAPLLAAVLAGDAGSLTELSCTFPSTTPTSLVSLTTGVEAGEHGILGFTLNVPGTDRVLTHIAWRDDPPAAEWQPVPTWFERLRQAGTDTTVLLPGFFEGSGLTEAAYRGADFRGVSRDDDYAQRLLLELRARPGLVYGYVSKLDTAAHVHGIASPEWARAAAAVDALLTRVLEGLPDDAALVVTADHGGLDVAEDARIDVANAAELSAGVRVVAGEPRVRYLHTVAGATPDVIATWQAAVGDRADVLHRDEAIEAGWFGPVLDRHRARIGDVVVICTDEFAVLATDHEPAEMSKLIGFHGAATPVETAIPLIALRR